MKSDQKGVHRLDIDTNFYIFSRMKNEIHLSLKADKIF